MNYVLGAVLIIMIVAGLGYYFATQSQTATTSSMMTSSSTGNKDTLIIGTTDSVATTLDPANAYDLFGATIIQNLGAPLYDLRPGGTDFVPALATNYTVSPDGFTWTFNLRQGVMFSDGTPFNATAVKYSFDRGIALNDPTGPFVGVGYGTIINRTEVTGPYQVVFHLNVPFAPFLALMPFSASYIVNPNYAPFNSEVNYTAGDPRHSTPMDLGPYILSEWNRVGGKDVEMRLDANPNYWNSSGGYPKTQHIIIKFYSDSTTLALAVQNGEVDLAYRQLRPTDIIHMESIPSLKVWKGAGSFIQYLVMQENIKPFDNPLVRRAVAAAINRTAIVSTVFQGQAQPLYSIVPIGMMSHQDVFKLYGDANYTYTQTVLSQLGYSSTNKLVIDLWYDQSGHYPSEADIATVLKSSLEASGVIQVNLQGTDWATLDGSNLPAGNMPMWIFGWYPDYDDPNDYTYNFFQTQGSSWLNDHYSSSAADMVIGQALASRNTTERIMLYGQAQQILATDVPLIPIFQSTAYAVSNPNVGGVVIDFPQILRYWLLYETVTSTT